MDWHRPSAYEELTRPCSPKWQQCCSKHSDVEHCESPFFNGAFGSGLEIEVGLKPRQAQKRLHSSAALGKASAIGLAAECLNAVQLLCFIVVFWSEDPSKL